MATSRFAHVAPPTEEDLKIARYMNDVQFMSEAWMRDFDYEEYAFHAERLQYKVHSKDVYQSHCDSCTEQMENHFLEEMIKNARPGIDPKSNPLN